jgi:hypothetical protein
MDAVSRVHAAAGAEGGSGREILVEGVESATHIYKHIEHRACPLRLIVVWSVVMYHLLIGTSSSRREIGTDTRSCTRYLSHPLRRFLAREDKLNVAHFEECGGALCIPLVPRLSQRQTVAEISRERTAAAAAAAAAAAVSPARSLQRQLWCRHGTRCARGRKRNLWDDTCALLFNPPSVCPERLAS